MKETEIQKYVLRFLTDKEHGLGYNLVSSNTVTPSFFIKEDLKRFISQSELNQENYAKLLKKFSDENALIAAFIDFLTDRILSSANIALFFNNNKSVTFEGVKIHLFYPSNSIVHDDKLFEQNIFSVVEENSFVFKMEDNIKFRFRPDISFFLNGIYFGYSELKANSTGQTAEKDGRAKVFTDYQTAIGAYHEIAGKNDVNKTIKRKLLKLFEKAIHITTTDIRDTFIIRNVGSHFDNIREDVAKGFKATKETRDAFFKFFKSYPLLQVKSSYKPREAFEEVFFALYSKKMIEREILYYNFLEREYVKSTTGDKNYKHNDGRLICPRPKQKFGADKIIHKIDEFLEHEQDPDYYLKKLRKELEELNIGKEQIDELIAKREQYQNNKHVYSLLMQYAAGFGKSNIIGWSTLMLKDLRKGDKFIYDKILLIVDRLQLRDQLDTKMHNMNIEKSMFTEASSQKVFKEALKGDKRIIVVNLQKFNSIQEVLTPDVVESLSDMRVAFLIDEIHRSNRGVQHEKMVTLFDDIQNTFDSNEEYTTKEHKKNLIIGFTATPTDNALARFGEFSHYAESEKMWIPFDSYTMRDAILDGYILNPLRGLVPVAASMYYEIPENKLTGLEEPEVGFEIAGEQDTDDNDNRYRLRKKAIYNNPERIEAISKFIVERLVSTVYPTIRGTAKAMLAVSSIQAAIKYKKFIDTFYEEIVKQKKYERFKEAPIYIVYSDSQKYPSPSTLNNNLSEAKVLQNFSIEKNGLIIVVDKLQTGFDEPKLQTLFLDKEIKGINAIQTISRVNRTTKYKYSCKIVDFSHRNVNMKNIKEAFEHFANMVISDFDPLADKKLLESYYNDLTQHPLYTTLIADMVGYIDGGKKNVDLYFDINDKFIDYIKNNLDEAKELKKKANKYFSFLSKLEYVIVLDAKYKEKYFLEFWKMFNRQFRYNNPEEEVEYDEVEVYFADSLGIVETHGEDALEGEPEGVDGGNDEPKGGTRTGGGKQLEYDIREIIKKENEKEEEIKSKIQEFKDKIILLFGFIDEHEKGKSLLHKIQHPTIDEEEVFKEFGDIVTEIFVFKKTQLGNFFIRVAKKFLRQLLHEFELTKENPLLSLTAEDNSEMWEKLIAKGETGEVEFKATLEVPVRNKDTKKKLAKYQKLLAQAKANGNKKQEDAMEQKLNPKWTKEIGADLNHSVLKTIAAFANTNGGTLIIGVDEDKDDNPIIMGTDKDIAHFGSKDKFLRKIDELLEKHFEAFINAIIEEAKFITVQGKELYVVSIRKSKKPMFMKWESSEYFYIRRLASTKDLSGMELIDYVREQF